MKPNSLLLVMTLFLSLSNPLFAKSSSKEPPTQFFIDLKKALKEDLKEDLKEELKEELFQTTYGAWTFQGSIEKEKSLLFNETGLLTGQIRHEGEAIHLSNEGLYLVSLGILTKDNSNLFEIQVNGTAVGKLTTLLDGTWTYAAGNLTLIIEAKADDTLQIVNKSSSNALIENGQLTLVQIH